MTYQANTVDEYIAQQEENRLAELTLAYQSASEEIHELSSSSSKDIRKVVVELRKKNLDKPQNIDPLTGVTNQQCFTLELEKSLHIHIDEYIGIISFEIRNYAYIVKIKGQEAGDEFLKHVAVILNENLRTGDMVMHYKDTNQFARPPALLILQKEHLPFQYYF